MCNLDVAEAQGVRGESLVTAHGTAHLAAIEVHVPKRAARRIRDVQVAALVEGEPIRDDDLTRGTTRRNGDGLTPDAGAVHHGLHSKCLHAAGIRGLALPSPTRYFPHATLCGTAVAGPEIPLAIEGESIGARHAGHE